MPSATSPAHARPEQRAGDRARGERDHDAEGHEHDSRPGEQRRRGGVGTRAVTAGERARDERHGDGGEHAPGRDLEEHVGHGVDRLVDAADAGGADGVREDEPSAEADDPRDEGDHGDGARGRQRAPDGEAGRRAAASGPLIGAHRPHSSSRRSTGLASMTRVKLTRSEARVSAARPARAVPGRRGRCARRGRARGGRRRRWPRCRRASSALAGRRARHRARNRRPWPRPRHRRAGARRATVTLRARPGRRSKRLTALAAPATTAPPTSEASTPPRTPGSAGRRSAGVDERHARSPAGRARRSSRLPS